MPCDICSAPDAEAIISPEAMSGAVQRGFNPFRLSLVPPSLGRLGGPGYPEKWSRQAIDGVLSHSNWALCSTCHPKLKPFLAP